MSTTTKNAQVVNATSGTLPNYWFAHRPSSDSDATTHAGGDLDPSGSGAEIGITLESSTTDQWTLMWTDASGSLYGTEQWDDCTVHMDDGDITLTIGSDSSVTLQQADGDSSTLSASLYG